MKFNLVKNFVAVLILVLVSACSARIGIPIPRGEGKPNKHPSGTIIIIETDSKPEVQPRSNLGD